VQYLQQRLNAHGASLTADGSFGPMTAQAVRAFQSSHGLVADAVVGPATWNALETAPIGGTPAPSGGGASGGGPSGGGPSGGGTSGGGTSGGGVAVATRPTIMRGATGEHVTYLQTRLSALTYSVTVDGIFGPGTQSAVRSFQASNGLTVDGIVGQATWAALG
jgi:peptidoglycan hydrolase-like protein with peptidoglycan-binding domain